MPCMFPELCTLPPYFRRLQPQWEVPLFFGHGWPRFPNWWTSHWALVFRRLTGYIMWTPPLLGTDEVSHSRDWMWHPQRPVSDQKIETRTREKLLWCKSLPVREEKWNRTNSMTQPSLFPSWVALSCVCVIFSLTHVQNHTVQETWPLTNSLGLFLALVKWWPEQS